MVLQSTGSFLSFFCLGKREREQDRSHPFARRRRQRQVDSSESASPRQLNALKPDPERCWIFRQQMRIIHTLSWTPSEIESYRQLAFGNVLDGMRELLMAMRDELHIDVADENVVSMHPLPNCEDTG